MKNSSMCKVVFIGAGYMAGEHLKAFKDLPNVEIAGIYSRTKIRAEKLALEFSVEFVSDSIEELYVRTKAQLVIISVNELSVREVCLEAFKYPWACLIEKPVGYDLPDAEKILEAAKNQNRQAFVALNRRHYSSTQTVLEDIVKQQGKRLIHVYDQEDPNAALKAGQPKLVVQNWMYANSIHMVDYLNMLGRGEIIDIVPVIHWTPECPQFVMAKIYYESGDVGIYEAIWNGPGPWAVTVTTQEKRWEIRPLEKAAVQFNGSRKLDYVDVNKWDIEFKPGLRAQAGEAVKAVLGEPHKLPSLDEAMKSMRLVHAIYGGGFHHG
jgi:predicted dehydrogenase